MTKRQIANRQAKIKAELAKGNFCGWGGDSEFLQYDWRTFQHWCCGQVMIGMGEGNGGFQNSVHNILRYGQAWEQYWQAKRALEHKYGLDKLPS